MEKRNYIPSFLIAYLISIGGINQVVGIVLKKSDGIMMMNLVPVAALLFLHFFISDKKQDLNLNKKALLFVYYIVSIIVIHKYAYRYTTISYTELLVYCFIPIYVSFYKIDAEKVLKYMMIFSMLVIPISNEFFKGVSAHYETIGMSTSYNVLPFVIAAAIHFIYYRERAGSWLWLCYGINTYYLLKVIYLGNRGPIITLIVFALLVIMHKQNPDGTIRKSPGKTMFITLSVGVISILVINNIEYTSVYNYKIILTDRYGKSAVIDDGKVPTGLSVWTEYTNRVDFLAATIGKCPIVESGSNSDGSYVKYYDGTMICYKTVTDSVAMTTAWGNLYEGTMQLGDWPEEFISTPNVNVTNVSSTGAMIECFDIAPTATSAGTVYFARAISYTSDVTVNVLGIGKWK